MIWKSYIALLFAFIFFGKFLVMDSKILVAILNTDKMAIVNPFCKEQNPKIAKNTSQETFDIESDQMHISIDTFCNTPFQFEVFTWKSEILPEEGRAYGHFTPPLPQSHQDRLYPPPQA